MAHLVTRAVGMWGQLGPLDIAEPGTTAGDQ